MQISKVKLNPKVEKQIKKLLAQVIADLKTSENIQIFLRDFLTPAENIVLAKRLAIALYLEKNKSYEEIRRSLKVSSATIASVQSMLEHRSEGFMLAVQQIKAEEWADQWAEKISKFFQALSGSKA